MENVNARNQSLERITLKELNPNNTNVFIVGIIIAKKRPWRFDNSYKANQEERAVWNFTLRDSPVCYINISYFGPRNFIFGLYDQFHVGDIVVITKPHIEVRSISAYSEKYQPRVTSPYYLTLSENAGSNLTHHETSHSNNFLQLLHLPTKPLAGAYTLADVHNRREKIEGIDLLGVIRSIGKKRTVKTRHGDMATAREITIIDLTSPGLTITLWDPDLISCAQLWTIGSTVLFVTDVCCTWSDFNRAMGATLTSRTIVTVDPVGAEADNLKAYASQLNLQYSIAPDIFVSNVSSINNVMNVQQVLEKIDIVMNSSRRTVEEQRFTALVYASVTQLDLDGFSQIISTKCHRCRERINSSVNNCINEECVVGSGKEPPNPISAFDLRLVLTDQTGSLVNCQLSDKAAENVLQCTVEEFLSHSDEKKSSLKWKLLMERCAVRILVMCSGFRVPVIMVLSCDIADAFEVANRTPHA